MRNWLAEASKVEGIAIDAQGLAEILEKYLFAGGYLLAAAKMDEDYKKNLLPADFRDWAEISKCFGTSGVFKEDCAKLPNYESVDLSPFLKHALINLVKNARSLR